MRFTVENQLVQDYVLLINSRKITIDDVPTIFNLREVVQDVINTQTN